MVLFKGRVLISFLEYLQKRTNVLAQAFIVVDVALLHFVAGIVVIFEFIILFDQAFNSFVSISDVIFKASNFLFLLLHLNIMSHIFVFEYFFLIFEQVNSPL